ncbi:hypothetical protein EU805_13395 [Salipiger sp. IMCC34102]|uniref:hypothetical protein n=1 Tax=Salipiger sp. IMCC34102 TaxID=2510647 RepID=UPI00101C05E6|nr:hypothetical protein [Salipiger sp. IMCC34102]RYH01646.1 hypothetical protein EU805_13395 [Salipiger sp. IMCC34102]
MEDHLPTAVARGLKIARRQSMQRGDRLSVHDGDQVYRIHDFSEMGMTLDAGVCDILRGRVDIYDGARHLYQALIQGSEVTGETCTFTFKWLQPARDRAASDFVAQTPPVSGLIAGT